MFDCCNTITTKLQTNLKFYIQVAKTLFRIIQDLVQDVYANDTRLKAWAFSGTKGLKL